MDLYRCKVSNEDQSMVFPAIGESNRLDRDRIREKSVEVVHDSIRGDDDLLETSPLVLDRLLTCSRRKSFVLFCGFKQGENEENIVVNNDHRSEKNHSSASDQE